MSESTALVVGAGVVGVCSALYLQRAGFAVTVLDRDGPGKGCSSGNAGMLGTDSCVPSALPGVLARLPSLLMPDGPLRIEGRGLGHLVPWLARFAASATPARVARISAAMRVLQQRLLECHLDLASDAGCRQLIRGDGKLHVYETEAGYRKGAFARALLARHAVEVEEISSERVRELVPSAACPIHSGLWFPAVHHCIDPAALVRAYADRLVRAGGVIARETVSQIRITGGGPEVVTDRATRGADCVVLAAGAWSRPFARALGAAVPLVPMRGYHLALSSPPAAGTVPAKWEERSMLTTPMSRGLRVTGIAELARLDAPANPARTVVLARNIRAVMRDVSIEPGSAWMGQRPATPDSLPVLGRAPASARVVLAFGHGHWGFGLGAVSGKIVAEIATGAPLPIDLDPYRAERF